MKGMKCFFQKILWIKKLLFLTISLGVKASEFDGQDDNHVSTAEFVEALFDVLDLKPGKCDEVDFKYKVAVSSETKETIVFWQGSLNHWDNSYGVDDTFFDLTLA